MQEPFPEAGVEKVIEPAFGAILEADGPLDGGESAVELRRESGEVMPFRLGRERRRSHAATVMADWVGRKFRVSGFRQKAATNA